MSSEPASSASHFNAELNFERLVFFSDAVMAIAITLLAVELKVPEIAPALAAEELPHALQEMTPRFISFVISFFVIGIYWMSHHRAYGFIKRYDTRLLLLNLIFLLFIVTLPFVTHLIGEYGNMPLPNVIYALDVAMLGFATSATWFYATHRHRLVDPALDPQLVRLIGLSAVSAPLIFLLSIPFALVTPYIQVIWVLAAVAAAFLGRRIAARSVTGDG
ncbi:MAG: DUF1211 domain-containing protein [Chloroflexi bacterium]|nr:DUF1211 domain-containing protein [Chloroflexota bacterium]